MNPKTYKYFDLHIAQFLKYALPFLAIGIIGSLILGFQVWLLPLLFCLTAGVLYLMKSGEISITSSPLNPERTHLKVKDFGNEILFETPLVADVWWNYSYVVAMKDVADVSDIFNGQQATPARASDIKVYLEIKDKTGQKVTFVEKIVFGNRFPNEANYALDEVDKSAPLIKVQRIDKLVSYLEDYIVDDLGES